MPGIDLVSTARKEIAHYNERNDMKRSDAYALIDDERTRQGEKWAGDHGWGKGDCSSPDVPPTVKAAVLAEESGEVARAVLDRDDTQLRAELVQVAAVSVAWLEAL